MAAVGFSEAQTVPAGISVTMNQDFFRQYESIIVDSLSNHLNGLNLQDWESEYQMLGGPKVKIECNK